MKPGTKRALVVLAICVVCTATVVTLWGKKFSLFQQMEWAVEDWGMRHARMTPMDDRLVFIGMDKPIYGSDFSEEELQQEPVLRHLQQDYPWSRAVWARLIEKLADAGAKVIVVDVVFANQNDLEGDAALKRVLEKYRDRVVLGYNISEYTNDRGGLRELQIPNSSVLEAKGKSSPVEDDRLGFVNTWPDADGVFRRASYQLTSPQVAHLVPEEVILQSLDARVLQKFGGGNLIPAGFDPQRIRFTGAPGSFAPYPVGYVLSPQLWKKNYKNGEFFRDKIVLIGPAAEIFHDQHDTPFVRPFRQMLGPEIHLNIINAALHGQFLSEPSLPIQLFVISMAGVCAAALCFLIRQPLLRFGLVLCVAIVYWIIAYMVFSHGVFSVWLTAIPTVALMSSSLVTLTYDYFLERREKARVRRTLERYVSKDVVKEVLDNPASFFNSLSGVRKPVTVLFSDIRGFTTLTESGDSAALVKQLNEYFQEMVGAVFSHRGSLDKFIGDAVMAVWGNIDVPGMTAKDGAQQAVATALAMKRSLRKLNDDWKARNMLHLEIGIGINHGEVIVGNLGCQEKMDPTIIGDPVNLGSRLEGLTKEYHLDLLLGEQVAPFVGDTYILRTVDFVAVKGKTKPVDVFTVMGDGAAQTVSMPVWLARYEDGVRLYRARKFSEAAAEFQECLRKQPDDYLSSLYLKRSQALIENPPDESWNGVFVMTKK
jgi:adenylate cyclase